MNPTAEQIQKNWEKHLKIVDHYIKDRKNDVNSMLEDLSEVYVMAPASGKTWYHNAFPGGYVDSSNITEYLEEYRTKNGLQTSDPYYQYVKKKIDLEESNEPYPAKKYWPFIEYSMTVETIDNTTKSYFNHLWKISPIFETMEKSLELAKGQRKRWLEKHIHYYL